jgi:ATP-dependent RNA helicase DDX49/DBP8
MDSPRKRRRIEEDSAEDEAIQSISFTAPSRIKRKPGDESRQGAVSAPPSTVTETEVAPPSSREIKKSSEFGSLGVRPWLVRSLANLSIKNPTKIQSECIPEILDGRDCFGISKTGSGKTVAFAVPILQDLFKDPTAIFALALTPTRELAAQIYEQFVTLASPHNLKALLVTGGRDMRDEAIALARLPHIVVATPGRLADHINSSGEDTIRGLRRLRYLVFDEADRLLDSRGNQGMFRDVGLVMSVLPPPTERQTMFFTATMTPELRLMLDKPPQEGKKPPVLCEVDMDVLKVPDTLKQTYLEVVDTHREHYLHMFLLTEGNVEKSVIIFCNYTETAQRLHHLLRHLDHRVTSLHSKLPQRQRTDNLGRFRAAAARILVATDVASRGLDIPYVGLVINYEIPQDPDDYIHRVGRTARAGRPGEAVTIVGRQRHVDRLLAIEERVGQKMTKWEEEGVNLEKRVLKDALKIVSEKKLVAMHEVEEGREIGGRKTSRKKKLRVQE